MKLRYFICALAAGTLLLGSCDNEKAITASEVETSAGKFNLPQGNTQYDDLIVGVYERLNTKIVYKDFDIEDMSKTWVAGGADPGYYKWEDITESDLDVVNEIVINRFFNFIDNNIDNNIGKKMLVSTPYYYITNDLRTEITTVWGLSISRYIQYNTTSLDSKTISIRMENARDAGNYTTRIYAPAYWLHAIYKKAFDEGLLTLPDGFNDGIDFTTPFKRYSEAMAVVPGHPDYLNYTGRRGFMLASSYSETGAGQQNVDPTAVAGVSSYNTDAQQFTRFFLFLALDPLYEKLFDVGYIYEDCPVLKARCEMFLAHMIKTTGLDLRAYNRALFSDFSGDIENLYRTRTVIYR